MTIRVLQTGLDPDLIDFTSPDFARFENLTYESLRRANDDNVAGLRAAGFDVDNILIDFGITAIDVIAAAINRKRYDAVLIGAGVRLVASNTLLFEALVNLVHDRLPEARFVFNSAAGSTPDDIFRWFDGPDAAGPRR
ncbi:hypothetical protein [Actinoplanes sp. N902-109]|uniref:hypothetical protein n=1 Tax=Actinoplanes sp. (strain N902-109) TaxID=649831 RepID=UPI00032940DF|nr:hypothetical protein [Actinoplanes sp. N902-109]AGL19355.1 hypothetical protein L083_5845 [Actinoplanes sp. N902-109]